LCLTFAKIVFFVSLPLPQSVLAGVRVHMSKVHVLLLRMHREKTHVHAQTDRHALKGQQADRQTHMSLTPLFFRTSPHVRFFFFFFFTRLRRPHLNGTAAAAAAAAAFLAKKDLRPFQIAGGDGGAPFSATC